MLIVLFCGFILFNEDGDVFFVYVIEMCYWDIFKGVFDLGENDCDVVLCEMCEEIGFVFDSYVLIELGCFFYCCDKELYLFVMCLCCVEVVFDMFMCILMFNSYYIGRFIFEMDVYCWIIVDEVL